MGTLRPGLWGRGWTVTSLMVDTSNFSKNVKYSRRVLEYSLRYSPSTRVANYSDSTALLCYRKDDRAMRPMRGCPENFRAFLTTPTATIPRLFRGVLFRSTQWMFLQNLNCVALPVPEIIGGTQKIWAAPGYAHAPFSPKFCMGFYSDWPCKCTR